MSLEMESLLESLGDLLVAVEASWRCSGSLPGRFSEAVAGFGEAGPAAFCASMTFNSRPKRRCAPSWCAASQGLYRAGVMVVD